DLLRLERVHERAAEIRLHVLPRDEHRSRRRLCVGGRWEVRDDRVRAGDVLQRVESELERLPAQQRSGIGGGQALHTAALLGVAETAHRVADGRIRVVEGEVALVVLARRDVRLYG